MVADLSNGDSRLAAEIAAVIGYDPIADSFAVDGLVVTETLPAVVAALLPLLPAGTDGAELLRDLEATSLEVTPVGIAGLRSTVAELAGAGLALGVATNDQEETTHRHLADAGVHDFLPFVACADSGHGTKPGPGMLRAFSTWAGLEPSACAMVGDSIYDLRAAEAAGFFAVAVRTGPTPVDRLAAEADLILDSVADLPAWLAG